MTAQRGFQMHAATWAAVNGFLFLIWLLTTPGGFPWFLFPAGGWGIALAIHAVATFGDPGDDGDETDDRDQRDDRDSARLRSADAAALEEGAPTIDELKTAEDPARYRTLGQ